MQRWITLNLPCLHSESVSPHTRHIFQCPIRNHFAMKRSWPSGEQEIWRGSQAAKRMKKGRMNLRKWRIIRSPEEKAGIFFLFSFCLTLMWIRLQFVMKWLFRSHEGSLSNSIHTSESTMLFEWSCEWGKSKSISFGWICKRLTLSSYQEL